MTHRDEELENKYNTFVNALKDTSKAVLLNHLNLPDERGAVEDSRNSIIQQLKNIEETNETAHEGFGPAHTAAFVHSLIDFIQDPELKDIRAKAADLLKDIVVALPSEDILDIAQPFAEKQIELQAPHAACYQTILDIQAPAEPLEKIKEIIKVLINVPESNGLTDKAEKKQFRKIKSSMNSYSNKALGMYRDLQAAKETLENPNHKNILLIQATLLEHCGAAEAEIFVRQTMQEYNTYRPKQKLGAIEALGEVAVAYPEAAFTNDVYEVLSGLFGQSQHNEVTLELLNAIGKIAKAKPIDYAEDALQKARAMAPSPSTKIKAEAIAIIGMLGGMFGTAQDKQPVGAGAIGPRTFGGRGE